MNLEAYVVPMLTIILYTSYPDQMPPLLRAWFAVAISAFCVLLASLAKP